VRSNFYFVLGLQQVLLSHGWSVTHVTSNPIGQNKPTPDTSGKADHSKPEILPALAKPEFQPTHAQYQITCKTEKNWWDKIKPYVECFGVILLATYTGFTIAMYFANKKSADAAEIAAYAAKESAELSRKQMEGVSAAKVEMPRGIDVSFPIPPFGQVRASFINKGHVISLEATLSVSLTIKNVGQNTERTIFSDRRETKTMIPPSDAPAISDFFTGFNLTEEEYKQLWKTQAYLIVNSSLDYDNGFEKRISQKACTAYLWGSPKFGRPIVGCDEVSAYLELARKLAKQ